MVKLVSKSFLLPVLAVLLFVSGCTTYNGYYTALATQPFSPYTLEANNGLIKAQADSFTSRHIVTFIPSGQEFSISGAVNKILEQYKGDYLANVHVERKSFQIIWLYHYNSWHITGDVMRVYK